MKTIKSSKINENQYKILKAQKAMKVIKQSKYITNHQ